MNSKTGIGCILILLNANTSAFAQHVNDTAINIGNEFSIFAANGEHYANKEEPSHTFTTYSLIKLIKGKKVIFSDTVLEYQLDSFFSPFFREIGPHKFELLLEVNDRPNMNYFLHLILSSDKVTHRDTIPGGIINCPRVPRNDGSFELHSFSCNNEAWGDTNNPMIGYTPVVYYDFRKNGIDLDTAMTIKTNTAIYGTFEGYGCNGYNYPEKVIYKKEKELKIEQ